ncbi:MAG: permease, partial [Desulfobacterales bacterium]
FLYLLLGVFEPKSLIQSLIISGRLILRIIPVLVFVVLLMGVINYFTSPRAITTYLRKKSGYKGWLFTIIAGVFSHGPVYAWYPLLRDLYEQGMKSELIALFLYCRAIKIPLSPLMAYYFGI